MKEMALPLSLALTALLFCNVISAADSGRGFAIDAPQQAPGRLRGTLHGDLPTSVRSWSVIATPAGTEAESPDESWARCDHRGQFEFDALAPGSYQLSLYAGHRSFVQHSRRRQTGLIAALGAGRLPAFADQVEIRSGEVARRSLELPPPGQVSGVVTFRGEPIADCQVFAWTADPNLRPPTGSLGGAKPHIDADAPPIGAPVAISGKDGRYRFDLLQPGRWQLFLRHRDGFVSSGPWPVQVDTSGQEIELDLQLGAATVELQLAPDWLAGLTNRKVSAFLFRAEDAGDNPARWGGDKLPVTAHMTGIALASAGEQRFRYLPAGTYMLRCIESWGSMIWQQAVSVDGDQRVVLRPAAKPASVAIEIPIRTPALPERSPDEPSHDHYRRHIHAVLQTRFEGIEPWVFAAQAKVDDGILRLPALPPGRYRVHCKIHVTLGFAPPEGPFDSVAELIVHPDGSTEPDSLDLR